MTNYALESCESITEARDVGRDELIGSFDSSVEIDDFVKVVVGAEVKIVDVASESSSEGDGELRLEVADLKRIGMSNISKSRIGMTDHAVGVDTGDGESEPVDESLQESRTVGGDLAES